jgi:hypothetical protein
MNKSCLVTILVCIGAYVAFCVIGKLQGDRSDARLDVIVADLVTTAQQSATERGNGRRATFVRKLRKLLDGKTVKWHQITDRAVQFFGFNAVATVELGLSDGSLMVIKVVTNGRECMGLFVEKPPSRRDSKAPKFSDRRHKPSEGFFSFARADKSLGGRDPEAS